MRNTMLKLLLMGLNNKRENKMTDITNKCQKCGNNLFYMSIIPSCDNCEHNAAWDSDECQYTTDLKTISKKRLKRNRVAELGVCEYGTAFGAGCHIFTCSKCGHKDYCPVVEDC